jgi:menaquinone-specific isochorismate synthase
MTARSRTREHDGSVDLLSVAGDHGVVFAWPGGGLAGRGEAVRLEVPAHDLRSGFSQISETLQSLDRAPGAQPVAFVSVPFRPTRPILALVPELIVRQTGEQATLTTIGDVDDELTPPTSPVRIDPPSTYRLTSSRAPKEWRLSVEEAVRRLLDSDLEKVVLARELVLEADAPFSQLDALRSLRRNYPSSYLYAIDGLVGASPELLIEREDRDVRSTPLAGTLPRSGNPEADAATGSALMHSPKDRAEHRFLSEMMRETLEPFCTSLSVPSSPEVLSLTNVHHLATPVRGVLKSGATSVLDLVAALHPTPAVGGRPTDAALALIEELEELDRGRYAGAVGWVDAEGNGTFAVAIRCAEMSGNVAKLYAGCGIVAASHPERELEETHWKFQAMLSALIRP